MAGEFRFIFRAKDYAAAVAFYRDGLELPIVHSWDGGTVFQAASGLIEVLAQSPGQAHVSLQGGELAYQVEDVDEAYRRVREKGLPLKGELADKPWGHRSFSVTDPDGIKVILYSIVNRHALA